VTDRDDFLNLLSRWEIRPDLALGAHFTEGRSKNAVTLMGDEGGVQGDRWTVAVFDFHPDGSFKSADVFEH
jgi:hypothetical protein